MNILTKSRQAQRGISMIGLIITLMVVAFFLTVGLKIVPIYLEHNTIRNAIESLVESGQVNEMSQNQLRQEISNSLRVNSIRDFDLDAVRLERSNNATAVALSYEKRVSLFSNIDAVVYFDERIE